MKDLFLDCNAHIPISEKAKEAIDKFNNSTASFGNPNAPNLPGREASKIIEECRIKIMNLLHGDSKGMLIFTNSATQAAEWGMEILKKISFKNTYINPIEHSSILSAYNKNFTEKLLPLKDNFEPNLDKISEDNIICTTIQNESGIYNTFNNFSGNLLFSDLTQAIGKVKVDLSKFDIAIFGSHKFGGPGNVGFLYLKNKNLWSSFGTGTRYGFDRAGTLDVSSIVGATAALEESLDTFPQRFYNMINFSSTLENYLFDKFTIVGKNAKRCHSTTLFEIPINSFEFLHEMEKRKIYIGLGSACGTVTGHSNLLKLIHDDYESRNFIRISQDGRYNETDAYIVINAIKEILKLG